MTVKKLASWALIATLPLVATAAAAEDQMLIGGFAFLPAEPGTVAYNLSFGDVNNPSTTNHRVVVTSLPILADGDDAVSYDWGIMISDRNAAANFACGVIICDLGTCSSTPSLLTNSTGEFVWGGQGFGALWEHAQLFCSIPPKSGGNVSRLYSVWLDYGAQVIE